VGASVPERHPSPTPAAVASGSSSPLRQMRGDPVVPWLRSIGAEEVVPLFVAENIMMRHVPLLTEEHLEELGISSLGMRLTLMAGIAQLRAGSSSQAQIAVMAQAVQELTHAIEGLLKKRRE